MMNQPQYGGMQQPFMQYAPLQVPQFTQPLTVEQIRAMKKGTNSKFTIALTPEEINVAKCKHIDSDAQNQFSLLENNDGSQHCYICNEDFNLVQLSKEEVEGLIASVLDVLQSIKTYYLDMPVSAASEFMTIIPLIKKIPALYEIAINNFNKYDVGLHNQVSGQNSFNILNTIMAPGYTMPGMMGGYNPGYGQPMGQPMGYGQPMGQPMGYGQPMGQPQGNMFGYYGQPQGQPMGQPQSGQPMPQQAQPQAPTTQYTPQASQNAVKVDKMFNTN